MSGECVMGPSSVRTLDQVLSHFSDRNHEHQRSLLLVWLVSGGDRPEAPHSGPEILDPSLCPTLMPCP